MFQGSLSTGKGDSGVSVQTKAVTEVIHRSGCESVSNTNRKYVSLLEFQSIMNFHSNFLLKRL